MQDVTRSIIVRADVATVYRIWADFENFPRFMKNIESVTKTGDRTSHWVMQGPMGRRIEWDAVTTRLEPDKRIAWNSKEGEGLTTSGQVTFNGLPANQTEITVTMRYVPPAGLAGNLVAELFGHPERRLEEDLRNFKANAEGMYSRIKE